MQIFILENEYVYCELDDSAPVLIHRWKKPPPGDKFRNTLLEILEKYIELSSTYSNLGWLADTRLLGEVDEETEKWFAEVWNDQLFNRAKVKIHAVIISEDLFDQYPMEKFKIDAEEKFRTLDINLGLFSDEEEAMTWVMTR